MWKEWTKKIKTFAEDITSPAYEEEEEEGRGQDLEDGDEGIDDAHRENNGQPQKPIAAGPPQSNRGAHRTPVDGSSSLLLETPARRLEKHYDEPTVERPAGATGFAAASSHAMNPATAPPPPAAAAAVAAARAVPPSASAPAVVTSHAHTYEDEEEEEEREEDGELLLSQPSSSSVLPMAKTAVAPRRGPPLAMAASPPQQQPQRNRGLHTPPRVSSTAAGAGPSSSLGSSSASPACTPSSTAAQPAATAATPTPSISAPAEDKKSTSLTKLAHLATSQQTTSPQERRIASLEAENAQMMADIRNYQEEVRVAHEQTVAYYEAQLRAAHREAAGAAAAYSPEGAEEQLESFKMALHTAAVELEKEQAAKLALAEQVARLEDDARGMKIRICELQAESAAPAPPPSPRPSTSSAHTNAEWAEKERECAELQKKLQQQSAEQDATLTQLRKQADADRRSLERQLHEAQAQLTSLKAASTTAAATTASPLQSTETPQRVLKEQEAKLIALQDEVTAWTRRAQQLEEKLAEEKKQNSAMTQQLAEKAKNTAAAPQSSSLPSAPASEAEVAQLRQQLQSAEAARRALEAQLQDAQAELMTAVTSGKQRQDTAQAAALEERTQQLQTAQLHADELEQQLAATEKQMEGLKAQLAAEQAKELAVHDSIAASSRASADEARQLAAKLQEAVSECTSLKAEVQQHKQTVDELTSRLNADTKAHKEALDKLEREQAKAGAALEDELAQMAKLKATAAEGKQKLEDQLQKVRGDLQHVQRRLAQSEEEVKAANKARDVAEAKAASAVQQCSASEGERANLQQQLQRCKDDLARQQQELKRLAEKDANSGASLSLAALTNMKRELEEKVQRLEVTMDQVRHMTVDTLVRLGVDVAQAVQQQQQQQNQQRGGSSDLVRKRAAGATGTSPPASLKENNNNSESNSRGSDGDHGVHGSASDDDGNNDSGHDEDAVNAAHEEARQRQAKKELPLLQLFSLLIAECMQQHAIVLRAERVQQEWEQTYEQARQVNESLNHQLSDAWASIGKLREDVSVKEAAARQMQSRVGSGDARLIEAQEELTRISAEVQQLREERESWTLRLQQAEAGAAGQAETLAALQAEAQTLQAALQTKDEELQSSQQSLDNLQMVLDRFQETKRHEVETLTLESHLEAEALKKEVEECRRVMEQHEQAKATLRGTFESQLAAKDAEVTTLYRKLAEVRKVLERTTSRHMDSSETSVDKRVVSQLLSKYIHAFIEQRKESEDMLKVLSGLLDWDEATQELAGLLPGPNNPRPPGSGPDGRGGSSGGVRTGLFGWRRAKPAAAAVRGADDTGAKNNNKAGLASMWVEFLLKESEGGKAGAAAAVATPSTPAETSSTDAPATAAPSASTTTPTAQ